LQGLRTKKGSFDAVLFFAILITYGDNKRPDGGLIISLVQFARP